MRKVFLLAYEQFPHAGVVRPFVNWLRGALGKGSDDELLGYSLGWPLEAELMREFGGRVRSARGRSGLIQALRGVRNGALILDDSLDRLLLGAELVRQFLLKLAVYVQVLYVTHSIFPSTGCPTCLPRRG